MRLDLDFVRNALAKAEDRRAGKPGPDCLFKIEMPASGFDKLEKRAAPQLEADPLRFDYMRNPPANPKRS